MGLGGGSRGTTHPRSGEGGGVPIEGAAGSERMSVMALRNRFLEATLRFVLL